MQVRKGDLCFKEFETFEFLDMSGIWFFRYGISAIEFQFLKFYWNFGNLIVEWDRFLPVVIRSHLKLMLPFPYVFRLFMQLMMSPDGAGRHNKARYSSPQDQLVKLAFYDFKNFIMLEKIKQKILYISVKFNIYPNKSRIFLMYYPVYFISFNLLIQFSSN